MLFHRLCELPCRRCAHIAPRNRLHRTIPVPLTCRCCPVKPWSRLPRCCSFGRRTTAALIAMIPGDLDGAQIRNGTKSKPIHCPSPKADQRVDKDRPRHLPARLLHCHSRTPMRRPICRPSHCRTMSCHCDDRGQGYVQPVSTVLQRHTPFPFIRLFSFMITFTFIRFSILQLSWTLRASGWRRLESFACRLVADAADKYPQLFRFSCRIGGRLCVGLTVVAPVSEWTHATSETGPPAGRNRDE